MSECSSNLLDNMVSLFLYIQICVWVYGHPDCQKRLYKYRPQTRNIAPYSTMHGQNSFRRLHIKNIGALVHAV